jgi:hypothetical protein
MQGLFKFNRLTYSSDAISDCAKKLKDLQKLKMTYPPKDENLISINLKA